MRIYLDRFEAAFAVLELEADDGTVSTVRVDRALISAESSEGDALQKNGEYYETDRALTDRRRRELLEKMDRLANRGDREP